MSAKQFQSVFEDVGNQTSSTGGEFLQARAFSAAPSQFPDDSVTLSGILRDDISPGLRSRHTFEDLRLYDANQQITKNYVKAITAIARSLNGTVYTFELFTFSEKQRFGRLLSRADRNGNKETLTYQFPVTASLKTLGNTVTSLWKVATVTDAYGRSLTYTYHPKQVAGRWVVASIAAPTGAVVSYTYGLTALPNVPGQALLGLSRVDHADGSVSTFAVRWDEATQQQVVSMDDPAAGTTHRRKEVYINSTEVRLADGTIVPQAFGRIHYLYNGAGELSFRASQKIFPDGRGAVIVFRGGNKMVANVYESSGDVLFTGLTQEILIAKQWSFETPLKDWIWDITQHVQTGSFKRIGSTKDALDRQTTYARDPDTGMPVAITHPDQSVSATTYGRFLLPLRETDELGRKTVWTYDAFGNALSKTVAAETADAATWTWTYNQRGQRLSETDPIGNRTDYGYDNLGQLTSVTEPADAPGLPRAVRTQAFNAAGRLVSTTDASGRTVTYSYDLRNRLVDTAYPDGSHQTATYATTGADAGLLIASTDRNGVATTFAYDGHGREIARSVAAGLPEAQLTTKTYLPGTLEVVETIVSGDREVTVYDQRNRRQSVTRFPKAGVALTTTYVYDDADQLIAQTDPYGRRTAYAYDLRGRAIRTVQELVPGAIPNLSQVAELPRSAASNPAYVIMETIYDAAGQVVAQRDGRGTPSTFTYTQRGQRASMKEADGTPVAALTSYVYDPVGNQVGVTDPRGFVTTMTYNGRNLRASLTEAAGVAVAATTTYTYTPTHKVASMTDALGRTTNHTYGVCCDRLVAIIDPAGFVTAFGYDPFGNRTRVTDANNLTTITAFDGRNRVVSITNAANETTLLHYLDGATSLAGAAGLGLGAGADGSAVITINPAGETLTEIRDGLGRTVRRIDGLGKATTMAYDALVSDGGVTLVGMTGTDPLAHATVTLADGAGRARVVIDPVAARTEHAYDANGNKLTTKRILPGSAPAVVWTCAYDARNRDVSCATPGTAPQLKSYDANSNLLVVVDGLGGVSASTYDARNRKRTTIDRINAITTFSYDAVSNLLTILDQDNIFKGTSGTPTVYTYDVRNLLVSETFPTGQAGRTVRSYLYDGGRRLTRRTVTTAPASAFTEVTNYQYDNANRLVTRSYADGKNDVFTYDPVSRLKTASSARYANRVSRTYDAASRLTAETLTYAAGAEMGIPLVVGYGYDSDDRLTTMVYPDGSVVARSYTDRNELKQIWDAGQSQQVRTYDAAGRLTSSLFGNNLTETRTYVPGDVLVASIVTPATVGGPVTSFTYTYDANKRKSTELDGAQSSTSQRFGYDSQDRLTTWKQGTGVAPADPATTAQTWTLSPVGDWNSVATTTAAGKSTQTRTHSNVHELLAIGTTALSYDAKGNLIKDDQGQTFAWDVENRLLSAANLKQGQGDSAAYAYDALGRRVRQSVTRTTINPVGVFTTTEPTTYVHAGAQEVFAITGDLTALNDPSADPEVAGAAPYNPVIGQGARGSLLADASATRYNFQPASTDTPDGWQSDLGSVRVSATGLGWTTAQTGIDRAQLGRPLYDSFIPLGKATWQIPVANGTHAVVIMCGDAASRAQTNNLLVNGVSVVDPTPYDGKVTNGYETGSFDGYALTVTVTNKLLTISGGVGALDPKINFIEIGAVGSTVDQTIKDRVTEAAAQATKDTAKGKAKTPPTVKRNVWGSYVDSLVSYTIKKPRKSAVRYYAHANSLFSVAAVTSATGAVVERWSYNAYGVPTIKNSAGATLAKSGVGQTRGYTGYTLDSETGLYFARARMYSSKLGRFVSRDMVKWIKSRPLAGDGYIGGYNLFFAYFAPNKLDPTGLFPGGPPVVPPPVVPPVVAPPLPVFPVVTCALAGFCIGNELGNDIFVEDPYPWRPGPITEQEKETVRRRQPCDKRKVCGGPCEPDPMQMPSGSDFGAPHTCRSVIPAIDAKSKCPPKPSCYCLPDSNPTEGGIWILK